MKTLGYVIAYIIIIFVFVFTINAATAINNLTVDWGDESFGGGYITFDIVEFPANPKDLPPTHEKYCIGFRSDGVVVWKKEKIKSEMD